MSKRPIVIVGAGASKHGRLPVTVEILPRAFQQEKNRELLLELDKFLTTHFHLLSVEDEKRTYPELALLLGLLDDAISQEHHFSPEWDSDRLRRVRRLVEYAIYSAVEVKSENDQSYYRRLLEWLAPEGSGYEPSLISVNYDLLADDAFIETTRHRPGGVRFPDYGCDIATEDYRKGEKFGRLLKLYGSLHWTCCSACQRMEVAFYSKNQLSSVVGGAFNTELLSEAFSPSKKGYKCLNCGGRMRPVLIAPTPMRGNRMPHIIKVWYAAECALRQADQAIFIGYGLPWSDLEVIYLLKRGLGHLRPDKIVVILPSPAVGLELNQFERGQRYIDVFGQDIRWFGGTFEEWMEAVKDIPVYSYEG